MAKKAAKKKVNARKPAAKKAAAKKIAPRKAAPKKAAAPRAAPQPKWKPKGTQDVIMSFVVRDAASAIDFYKTALGAQELSRHTMPDGKSIMHAEIRVGDTVIALNDESPMSPTTAAGPNHKPTGAFILYTKDCDAVFNRAIQAGARPAMPLADMFWGDRMGMVSDPFGQVWMIATHQKDMSEEELRKAGDEAMAQMAAQHQQAPAAGQTPPASAAH